MPVRDRFWQRFSLQKMSREEWEALCDGCGKCCLHKLQDEDTDRVYFTRVACRLLDGDSCRCRDYTRRRERVADCLVLEPDEVDKLDWLPATCAYRLVAQAGPLPDWHYLICGDRDEVHRAGASVRGRTLSAEFVHQDDMQAHIIEWID